MTQKIINLGTANKGNGDPLRTAFSKVNDNFTELYTALGLNVDGTLNLGAFEFNDNVMTTTDSSSIIIDQATSITSDLTVGGDILPSTNYGGNLGSPAKQWNSLYVSNNTIYLNNIPISLDVENRLTINGNPISSTIEYENIPNAPKDIADLTDTTGLLVDLTSVDSITFWDSSVQTTAYRYSASDTAPTITTGALWFNTDEGKLYVNYDNIWVDANPTEIDPSAIRFNDLGQIELPDGGDIVDVNGQSVLSTDRLVNGANTVSLGSDGKLTLPNGSTIGDADTFAGVPITTARGTILLGNLAECAGGESHFHIMKGGQQAIDLFLGDDSNYVKLPDAGGVEIATQNFNQYSWIFSTDGTLTFPDDTVQNTAWTGITGFGEGFTDLLDAGKITTSKLYNENPNPGLNNQYTLEVTNGGVVVLPNGSIINGSTIRGVAGTGELNYTGITIGPNSNDAEKTWMWVDHANAYITTNNFANTWTFNNSGALTFPQGTKIATADGTDAFLIDGAVDKDVQIYTYSGPTPTAHGWTFGADGDLTVPGGIKSETAINIDINLSDSTLRRWTFGEDGDTVFPNNVSINYSGNNIQFPRIIADSGKAFSVQGQGTSGSAALSWTVDPDAAGQYAAVAVTRAGGGNLAKVILQAQSDSGDAGTAKIWKFDETGNITLPNGSVIKDTDYLAVAFGSGAGTISQGFFAVAVGSGAGYNGQGNAAVAIGSDAGSTSQGLNAVAVGAGAGYTGQGINAVAIGIQAGYTNQAANSIILNATGTTLNQTTANTFTVKPVRQDETADAMYYNSSTGEITYADAFSFSVAADDSTQRLISNNESIKFIGAGKINTASDAEGNITITGADSEGSWTVTTGTNTYNFTVPSDGTYTLWVKGNIPNGIITWNATLSITNTNVPAIGYQYAWNYTGGGSPILLTAIPDQIRGTAGAISTDATYVGSTSNRFDFTIANTSGAPVTVYYGYTKI
jgi:hypothetical protein